jgi:hypothetical protein
VLFATMDRSMDADADQTRHDFFFFAGGSQDAECTYGWHIHQNKKV